VSFIDQRGISFSSLTTASSSLFRNTVLHAQETRFNISGQERHIYEVIVCVFFDEKILLYNDGELKAVRLRASR
jgi:hypothetical protein